MKICAEDVIGYLCKNCGKEKGSHKSKTLECKLKGRGKFRGFDKNKFYEEDLNKPVMGYTL